MEAGFFLDSNIEDGKEDENITVVIPLMKDLSYSDKERGYYICLGENDKKFLLVTTSIY